MECNFENCGYYTDGECNICGMGISGEDTFCRLCKDNPNCYYKQLKQLQQDYVNLSKSFEHLKSSYQENQEYGLQLKAENIELKERNEKIIVGYIKLSERYKQTLQGVKAVVCGNYEIIDPQGRKDILKLITKAEEE